MVIRYHVPPSLISCMLVRSLSLQESFVIECREKEASFSIIAKMFLGILGAKSFLLHRAVLHV